MPSLLIVAHPDCDAERFNSTMEYVKSVLNASKFSINQTSHAPDFHVIQLNDAPFAGEVADDNSTVDSSESGEFIVQLNNPETSEIPAEVPPAEVPPAEVPAVDTCSNDSMCCKLLNLTSHLEIPCVIDPLSPLSVLRVDGMSNVDSDKTKFDLAGYTFVINHADSDSLAVNSADFQNPTGVYGRFLLHKTGQSVESPLPCFLLLQQKADGESYRIIIGSDLISSISNSGSAPAGASPYDQVPAE